MDVALEEETDLPVKKIPPDLVVPKGRREEHSGDGKCFYFHEKARFDGKCFICDTYLRAVNLAWHRIAQHWIKLANAAPDTACDRSKRRKIALGEWWQGKW